MVGGSKSTPRKQNRFVPLHHSRGLYKKAARGNNKTPQALVRLRCVAIRYWGMNAIRSRVDSTWPSKHYFPDRKPASSVTQRFVSWSRSPDAVSDAPRNMCPVYRWLCRGDVLRMSNGQTSNASRVHVSRPSALHTSGGYSKCIERDDPLVSMVSIHR